MDNQLLQGELVRLTAENPQIIAEAFARWSRDSEYWRLSTSDPSFPRSVKKTKEWLEKDLLKEKPEYTMFIIRRLEDDRLIGETGLESPMWSNGDAYVGIGLGEQDCWGKGYGTDAMRLILKYAFTELNLFRVSLNVFEYNPRAIRSYEKAGFKHEGRIREFLHKDGKYYDLIYMGILRSEWQEITGN